MTKKQSSTWDKQKQTFKATQIAFEVEQQIARRIRLLAAEEGLTPSDQIRKLIGLTFSAPKRPRLTASLTPMDYEKLGEKYKITPSDTLAIKRKIIEELIELMAK
ncbi:MAG: hypothetical protein ABFS18_11125 [Thermodesulfobacteriota bacterium]